MRANPPVTPRKTIIMDCHHEPSFVAPWPKIGTTVYCRWCMDYRKVVGWLSDYTIRCKGCPLSRYYGRDKDAAYRAASKHALKYPDHVVSIKDGGLHLDDVALEGQGVLEPFERDLKGRTAMVKQHQAELRTFLESLPKRDLTELPPY